LSNNHAANLSGIMEITEVVANPIGVTWVLFNGVENEGLYGWTFDRIKNCRLPVNFAHKYA
jgi:hypothetical protein